VAAAERDRHCDGDEIDVMTPRRRRGCVSEEAAGSR